MKTVQRVRPAVRSKQAPATKKLFCIVEGARPERGARLYAHTHAVLRVFGLLDGKTAPVKGLIATMGRRAVDHHLKQTNFAAVADSVKLTTRGRKVFDARVSEGRVSMELVEAFYGALTKGKASVKMGIEKDHIHPVAGLA